MSIRASREGAAEPRPRAKKGQGRVRSTAIGVS